MSKSENHDDVRSDLARRLALLFGEDRAAAARDEIDAVAAAIRRARRMQLEEFAGLDPKDHDR